MAEDRVEAAQKQIQDTLPPKSEYVVNTSEFLDVKARLMAMHARHKVEDRDANRPRLRKSSSGGTIPVEDGKPGETSPGADDEDDRPVLKRR
jgi:hypothetical protein